MKIDKKRFVYSCSILIAGLTLIAVVVKLLIIPTMPWIYVLIPGAFPLTLLILFAISLLFFKFWGF